MTRDPRKAAREKVKRAARNRARRKMIAAGLASVGDGRDVHHRDGCTSNNSRRNLAMLPRSINRSRRGAGRKLKVIK